MTTLNVFRCVLGQIIGNPLPSAFFEEQVHGGRHPSDDKRYTIGTVHTLNAAYFSGMNRLHDHTTKIDRNLANSMSLSFRRKTSMIIHLRTTFL